MNWASPPGYAETVAKCREPQYGWIVATPRREKEKDKDGKPKQDDDEISAGVISVPASEWEKAKKTYPYRYLNKDPRQPLSVAETKALVKEQERKRKERKKRARRS